MIFCRLITSIVVFFVILSSAWAVEPDERLANPVLETRARAISAELRCLVCQNQSIDDSNAPLARDLRLLVREMLSAGKSDAEVMTFLIEKFGEFVLLRPRFIARNALLWLAPFALLVGVMIAVWQRRRSILVGAVTADESRPLSNDEKRQLEKILTDETAR